MIFESESEDAESGLFFSEPFLRSDGLEGVCAPLFGPGLDAASDSTPKKLLNLDEKSTSIILILHNKILKINT